MSKRTYYYCRVSTTEQTTQNQVQAFLDKGYEVHKDYVIEDIVSGSVCAMQREGFKALVDHKLMRGDTLVVLKLDRLGRDNIDVQQTIGLLSDKGINVHSLDLPARDLTTPEGKLMIRMFTAFAEFERDRIRERTIEGQARAKAEGKKIGRPNKVNLEKVANLRRKGISIANSAKFLDVSQTTIKRLTAEAKQQGLL